MAQDGNLRVQISANTKDLTKGLKRAEAGIKDFGKSTKQAGAVTNKMGKNLSVNTVPALTSFSQVVQDAPYGIRGVANNITQLTSQFGYLSKSTGGAKNALKAMIGSLAGPAGILLAVSLVTSALVTYGDKIKDFINRTSDAAKKQRELTEATKEFIGSVGEETSKLNALLSIARDDEQSKNKRKEAVKKLNELYPDYLGNLTLEGINSETTSKQVDLLTQALVRQATVKGLLSKISETAAKKFEAENKPTEEYVSFLDKIGDAFSDLLGTSDLYTNAYVKGGKKRTDAIETETKKIGDLQDAINKILKDADIDFDAIFGGGTTPKKPPKDTSIQDRIKFLEKMFKADQKIWEENRAAYQEHLQEVEDMETSAEDARLEKLFKAQQERINAIYGGNALELALYDAYVKSAKSKYLAFSEWKKTQEGLGARESLKNLVEFDAQAESIIAGSIANTFAKLGEVIGTALAEGGNVFMTLGNAIIQGIVGFLGEMGKLLIKYGTLAVLKGKLDLAILAGGPIAIGAGLAAIGLGVALTAASAALGALATSGSSGGEVSTSSGADSNFRGSRVSSFSGGSGGGGRYVFEIEGTKLVGVLRNTVSRNSALGGSLTF